MVLFYFRTYCYFFFASIFCVIGLSCKRAIVDNSLQRTEESMRKFMSILSAAQDGWNACIIDKKERRWHFWMRFYDNGYVEMKADMSKSTSLVQKSQYAVRELQQPTLTFATYNYISRLADPDSRQGKTESVDIQYAFSDALVKDLTESKDNNIRSFALQGRLYQAKAYFSRIGKTGIIADTSLAIKLKLDSIRWKDSANVNVITKKDAMNHSGTNYTSENVFLYDLHTGTGDNTVYKQVIGITSFNRKGAALIYYVDCDGYFKFNKASEDVKVRRSFVDGNFAEQWTSGYYDNFRWDNSNNIDTTRLLFTYHRRDGSSEPLAFESKNLSNLSSVTSSLQNKPNEDTGIFFGSNAKETVVYDFDGFTARNIRDAWNLKQNGKYTLRWRNGHDEKTGELRSNIFLTGNKGLTFIRSKIKNNFSNEPYNLQFMTPSLQRFTLLSPIPMEFKTFLDKNNNTVLRRIFLRYLDDNSASLLYCKLFSDEATSTTTSSNSHTNLYTLLPVVLGFQLHRRGGANTQNTAGQTAGINCDNSEPSGVLIPVYLRESVN